MISLCVSLVILQAVQAFPHHLLVLFELLQLLLELLVFFFHWICSLVVCSLVVQDLKVATVAALHRDVRVDICVLSLPASPVASVGSDHLLNNVLLGLASATTSTATTAPADARQLLYFVSREGAIEPFERLLRFIESIPDHRHSLLFLLLQLV